MYAKKSSGIKLVVLLLALVLLLGCGVGGTLAWLSAKSDPVTNTFTVGDINILLQEHPFQAGSTTELDTSAEPVEAISSYRIVPGGSQPKDPFVTVKGGSEACYVYVCITNNLAIDNQIVVTYDINTTNWVEVKSKTDANGAETTLYRYKEVIPVSTDDQVKPIFSKVNYADSITKETIGDLNNKTITLTAFAHQSEYTTPDVVDAEAIAQFGLN